MASGLNVLISSELMFNLFYLFMYLLMKLVDKDETNKQIIGFYASKGRFRGEYLHQWFLMGGVEFRPGIS